MTEIHLRADLCVTVQHVTGKYASRVELAELFADVLASALEEIDSAELETSECAEYVTDGITFDIRQVEG